MLHQFLIIILIRETPRAQYAVDNLMEQRYGHAIITDIFIDYYALPYKINSPAPIRARSADRGTYYVVRQTEDGDGARECNIFLVF
jgi:hypothetical protein